MEGPPKERWREKDRVEENDQGRRLNAGSN